MYHVQVNSKWITNLNLKSKTIKLLEKKMYNSWKKNDYLMTSKFKTFDSALQKTLLKEWNHISNKGLVFMIYIKNSQSNGQKIWNIQLEKYVKSCWNALVIKKMQIKTIMWYHYIWMAKWKDWPYQVLMIKCMKWNSHIVLVAMWNGSTTLKLFWKTVWQFLKLNI